MDSDFKKRPDWIYIEDNSKWQNKLNPGEIFTVVGVANTRHRHKHYPVTVVFTDERGGLWAKTIGNFLYTMKPVESENGR